MKNLCKKISIIFISSVFIITCLMSPAYSAFAQSSPITTDSASKLTFAAWADPQVASFISSREKYVKASSEDLKNSQSKIDALVLAGDITENAAPYEYSTIYDNLADTGIKNFITATGNHDVRTGEYADSKKKFVDFTNDLNAAAGSTLKIDSMHYSYTLKGYKFIVLGSDETQLEEATIGEAQLEWLDAQLKSSANKGKPVFVILHQVLKNTHGLPDTWGSSVKTAGSVGPQSDEIQSILNKYKNIILISGHLHTGFGEYSYQKIGNIHSVNLPSVGVDNDCGSYNENGLGYITEVFDNKVVFKARNFNKGEFVPKYNITIYIDRVKSSSLSATTYTYNGKAKKPTISIYNYNGQKISSSNYTVTYPKGRINPGEYKIKVTFKNAYKGNPTLYKTFKILPKGTSLSSLKAGSKKITVKWKKQSTQTTGYQIQYSTSSKFTNAKTVTVSKNSTTSKTISKLKAKKKYYVRIRTYKTVNGKKIYSSWSKAKSVTTKK
ncbi:MAG: metallophosphoesterase [Eubacterium sp.]